MTDLKSFEETLFWEGRDAYNRHIQSGGLKVEVKAYVYDNVPRWVTVDHVGPALIRGTVGVRDTPVLVPLQNVIEGNAREDTILRRDASLSEDLTVQNLSFPKGTECYISDRMAGLVRVEIDDYSLWVAPSQLKFS